MVNDLIAGVNALIVGHTVSSHLRRYRTYGTKRPHRTYGTSWPPRLYATKWPKRTYGLKVAEGPSRAYSARMSRRY